MDVKIGMGVDVNEAELNAIKTWFLDYAVQFAEPDGNLHEFLELKLEHSRQVADNARGIALDTGWDVRSARMAEALGWLHDVGRFQQFAQFGHFHDAGSVNHGECGYEIVQSSDALSSLPDAHRLALLDGIRYHNAKDIPETLPPESLPLLRLIRDADKLDIYRVVCEGLQKNGFQELKDMWPHVDLQGPVSDRMLQDVKSRSGCDTAHIHSLADFVLLQMAWIYELNYPASLERVHRRGVLGIMRRFLPDDSDMAEVLDEMDRFASRELEAAAMEGF